MIRTMAAWLVPDAARRGRPASRVGPRAQEHGAGRSARRSTRRSRTSRRACARPATRSRRNSPRPRRRSTTWGSRRRVYGRIRWDKALNDAPIDLSSRRGRRDHPERDGRRRQGQGGPSSWRGRPSASPGSSTSSRSGRPHHGDARPLTARSVRAGRRTRAVAARPRAATALRVVVFASSPAGGPRHLSRRSC